MIELDIIEQELLPTSQVNKITATTDIYSGVTKSFKLPKTAENKRKLQLSDSATGISLTPYRKTRCRLTLEGIELIEGDLFVIDSTDDYYNCVVKFGNTEFFGNLGDSIRTLDLSELDEVWNLTNIVNSWTNTFEQGYVWTVKDTGVQRYSNYLEARFQLPAVYLLYLLEKIAEEEEFELTGDFWQRDDIKSDLIELPTINSGATQLERMQVEAKLSVKQDYVILFGIPSGTFGGTEYQTLVFSSIIENTYGHFAGNIYTAPTDVTLTVSGSLFYIKDFFAGLTAIDTLDYSFNVSLKEGERLQVKARLMLANGYIQRLYALLYKFDINSSEAEIIESEQVIFLFNTVESIRILANTYVRFSDFEAKETALGMHYCYAENLPEISKKDLFKATALKYGLIYKTDIVNRFVYAMRFEDIVARLWSNDFYDWTGKLDLQKERGDIENLSIEFMADGLARTNVLEWNNDDTVNASLGEGSFLIDNENMDKEKSFGKFPFGASELTALNDLTVIEMLRYQAFGDKATKVNSRLTKRETTSSSIDLRGNSRWVVYANSLVNNSDASLGISVNGVIYTVDIEMNNSTIHYGMTVNSWAETHGKELLKIGIIATPSASSNDSVGIMYLQSASLGSPIDSVAFVGAVQGSVGQFNGVNYKASHTGTIAFSSFVDGDAILNEHYTGYQRAMNYFKRIKARFMLNSLDFTSFDHYKPVFINRLGWFFVEKINGYKLKGTTEVVMISLDNFIQAPELRIAYSFDLGNNQIDISNESVGYVTVKWYFGDGTSSYELNPAKKYVTKDVYTVTQVITDSAGVQHRTTKKVFSNIPNLDFRYRMNSIYLAL